MARGTRLVFLGAALAILLLLIGWAVFAMRVPERCDRSPLEGLTSFALLSASIGGFVGGHVLGRWIKASKIVRMPDHDARPGGGVGGMLNVLAGTPTAAVVVQGALVLLLALAVVLLAYETLALVDTRLNWPITYYVRCFAHTNPVAAGLEAFALSSLVGQWVWYPSGDD